MLVLCAVLGVVASYCWRVFYGLDARGVPALGVTAFCAGLAVLAGAAALALRRVQDFAKKRRGLYPFVRRAVRLCQPADADPR